MDSTMTCVTTDVFLSKAKLPRFLIKKQATKIWEEKEVQLHRFLTSRCKWSASKSSNVTPEEEAGGVEKLLPLYRPTTYKRSHSAYLRRPHIQSETCSQTQQKEYKVEFWLMIFPFHVLQKFSFCLKIQVFLNVRLLLSKTFSMFGMAVIFTFWVKQSLTLQTKVIWCFETSRSSCSTTWHNNPNEVKLHQQRYKHLKS